MLERATFGFVSGHFKVGFLISKTCAPPVSDQKVRFESTPFAVSSSGPSRTKNE